MSENLTIEAPNFEQIKSDAGVSTRDAISLLWYVANDEAAQRRRGIRRAQETEERKVVTEPTTSNQNNYDAMDATCLAFTGASAINLTGIRNGTTGRLVHVLALGAGTVTVKYDSASSDAANRFDMAGAADVAVTTGKSFVCRYVNSRWRQLVLA